MGKVIITVTCDWDALDYTLKYKEKEYPTPWRYEQGINAILAFHKYFGGKVPITHFVCPAYFPRKPEHTKLYSNGIQALVKCQDEMALHIHCWRSLVEACGVTFIDPAQPWDGDEDGTVPDWGRTHTSALGMEVDGDYGHGVPLGVYSTGDIRKLLRGSRAILCKNAGLDEKSCVSFRTGGWMTSDAVFSALEQEGFKYEASAVNHLFWKQRQTNTLDDWLMTLWGGGGDKSYLKNRRFKIAFRQSTLDPSTVTDLQPRVIGGLVEVPDTGVLADYVDNVWMKKHLETAVKLASSGGDVYISFGFHLESGGDPRFFPGKDKLDKVKRLGDTYGYIERIADVMEAALKYDSVVFARVAEVGKRFEKFID